MLQSTGPCADVWVGHRWACCCERYCCWHGLPNPYSANFCLSSLLESNERFIQPTTPPGACSDTLLAGIGSLLLLLAPSAAAARQVLPSAGLPARRHVNCKGSRCCILGASLSYVNERWSMLTSTVVLWLSSSQGRKSYTYLRKRVIHNSCTSPQRNQPLAKMQAHGMQTGAHIGDLRLASRSSVRAVRRVQ